jgi:hypothetical protein
MDFSNWDLLVFVSKGVDDSCFNAFSRVDMRVEVKIPGGVKTQVIDERGNKLTPSQEGAYGRQEATETLWLETYVSSMIRSLLYADDESYRITGYRRLNPIPNKEAERRFLDAAGRLFSQGTPRLRRR